MFSDLFPGIEVGDKKVVDGKEWTVVKNLGAGGYLVIDGETLPAPVHFIQIREEVERAWSPSGENKE